MVGRWEYIESRSTFMRSIRWICCGVNRVLLLAASSTSGRGEEMLISDVNFEIARFPSVTEQTLAKNMPRVEATVTDKKDHVLAYQSGPAGMEITDPI